MVLLGTVLTVVLQKVAAAWAGAEGSLRPSYAAVNLSYTFLAAVAGGYVTAAMGDLNPLSNVLALGIVVLVIGAISVLQSRGQQRLWYQIVVLVLSAAGVFVGGLLRLKLLGLL